MSEGERGREREREGERGREREGEGERGRASGKGAYMTWSPAAQRQG